MAEIKLRPLPPLDGAVYSGTNISLSEIVDLQLTSFAVPHGGERPFTKTLEEIFGLTRPSMTQATANDQTYALPLTLDQVLVAHADTVPLPDTGGAAYLTDQTGNWCVVEMEGADARAALERICPIDLHPDAFGLHSVARTAMEHMAVIIMRVDTDRFLLLSASSSAASFWHALVTSIKNVSEPRPQIA